MNIYRYVVLYCDNEEIGIFAAGFDFSRIIEKYGVKNWDQARELSANYFEWLINPGMAGEYWFTEDGNDKFKHCLDFIIDRIPREGNPKAICRKMINLNEIPNWESILKYQDDFQVVF